MLSIPLGPLALPAAPLLLLLSAWLAAWLADRWPQRTLPVASTRPAGPAPGKALTHAVLAGLVVARLAHLGLHHEAYWAEPWAIVDLRDGGWHIGAGWAAGLAWLAWQVARHAAWRQALAVGAAAGSVVWSLGTVALAAMAPRDLPDLVLTDWRSGQPVRLREVAARAPVVVNLWATWCGPCRREMPVLAAAQAQHPGVVFVFVNQGESADAVRRYLDAERLNLATVLLDPASQLGPALASSGLPTTVFFDRQGRRTDAHLGALNSAALAAKLAPLTASKQ
jgi:thiol-disulfide isomerase/thioredoxin